jgi:ParB family chromosome partitioning protein
VGLLQNLVVHPADQGFFAVCAGSRRLAALQHNRDAGLIPADHKVNCVVVDVADALQVSLAENYAREAMNPADEARAFANLVAEGRSHAEIAASFGQTERYVRARERLGRLAEPVFEAFAARALSIEQAQAFAVSDDQARQATVFAAWERAGHWERNAAHIRTLMTENRVRESDPRVRLIGRDAYVAAGGAVDEDLFGDSVFYIDAELLTRLAQTRLDETVDAEIAAGWRWGATMLKEDWSILNGLERLYPADIDLSEADQTRWNEIEGLLEDENADEATIDALNAELEALDAKTTAFADAQMRVSGVIAILHNRGEIVIERGLQRPEDVALAARTSEADREGEGGDEPAAPDVTTAKPPMAQPHERVVFTVGGTKGDEDGEEDKRPRRDPYPAALRDDLRTALKGALQIAVAEDPALARDLLEYETVMQALTIATWRGGVLQLRVGSARAQLKHDGWGFEAEAETLPGAKAERGFMALRDDAAFAGFRALDAADRDALLALAVAMSLRAALPEDRVGADYDTDWKALAAATAALRPTARPDLRRIWTPTAENFLGRVTKQILLDVIEATLGADQARLMMGAKKGELVEHLHAAFNDAKARAKLDAEQRARLDAWTPAPLAIELTAAPASPQDDDGGEDDADADAGCDARGIAEPQDEEAADDAAGETDSGDDAAGATAPLAAE